MELAAKSIKYGDYLTWNLHGISLGEDDRKSTDKDKEKDSDLLNAVIGRLSDGIF